FTSLMNSVRHNTSKLKEYIAEARKNKLKLSSPSINQSNSSFELVNKEEIRFGLTAIKGIRRDFVEDILNERKQNGPFQSVDQFLIRNGPFCFLSFKISSTKSRRIPFI